MPRNEVRAAAAAIRANYTSDGFMGPPIPDDMGPADILLERVKVMAQYVRWLDLKLQAWPDELVALGKENLDNKGSMQVFPTHMAAWLHEWHVSNDALVNYVKIALSANIDERRVAMAERESDTIMALLQAAFDRLELSAEQTARIPSIMGAVIRSQIDGETAS